MVAGRAEPTPVSTAAVPSASRGRAGSASSVDGTSARASSLLHGPFRAVAGEDDGRRADGLHGDHGSAAELPGNRLAQRGAKADQPEVEAEAVGGLEQPRPVDEQRR